VGEPDERFESLFRTHYAPLVRALTFAAGSREAASDAVQDSFVQLHRHWTKLSRYDEPVAWLRRVAVNRVRNQRRSERRARAALWRKTSTEHAGPDGAALDLHDALKRLPRGQRLVVGLHYLADLSVRQVAEALEVSEGTVKSQLHDARRALRTGLEVADDDR